MIVVIVVFVGFGHVYVFVLQIATRHVFLGDLLPELSL
jgi:hypothetical protein